MGGIVDNLDDGPLFSDPFGDGASFSYVFKYADQLYLGPDDSGQGCVRSNADGSAPESIQFSFFEDTDNAGGSTSSNSSSSPYPSIGASGCTNNSNGCEPDNENGRGLFTSGTLNGQEWPIIGFLVANGDYLYVGFNNATDGVTVFRTSN